MTDLHGIDIVLWATDIPALARFLEAAAGMAIEAQHPGYATLSLGASHVTLHADEAHRTHPWFNALSREGVARGIGAELRLPVASVNDSYRKALAQGALSIFAPSEVEGVIECQVMGPDGYLFSLYES